MAATKKVVKRKKVAKAAAPVASKPAERWPRIFASRYIKDKWLVVTETEVKWVGRSGRRIRDWLSAPSRTDLLNGTLYYYLEVPYIGCPSNDIPPRWTWVGEGF